jgi:two-component system sensor histidine kinase QseC
LTHNTAHELRTPLAVVAAQAHALVTAPDGATAEAARQGIVRGVKRTSHLVAQLLTLAGLESPSASRTTEPIDLVALCRQHLIDLTPLADARGIEMSLVSPEHCQATVLCRPCTRSSTTCCATPSTTVRQARRSNCRSGG